MDSEESSASWWLHREAPEPPLSSPLHLHRSHQQSKAYRADVAADVPRRPNVQEALSIDQSPEVPRRPAAFVVHQRGEPIESLPRPHEVSAAQIAKLESRCAKWQRRYERAMTDNRVLAEEVQRLREEAARTPAAATPTPAPPAVPAEAPHSEEEWYNLRQRVQVLEQECQDQRAQLRELTSPEHARTHMTQEVEVCWPLVSSIADDGEQFTTALAHATAEITSTAVATVAARLPNVAASWRTLHEATLSSQPPSLQPSLQQLCDTITDERDVLAHLTSALLASHVSDPLVHVAATTDTRLREMEEDHLAEMEEAHRVIRDLEKRLAAANALRRLPWSALAGNEAAGAKGFTATGYDSVPPSTPLADERNSGFLSAGVSTVAEGKSAESEKSDAATQTMVSLEFIMAVAHAPADGMSRMARRSKELDLIDIMAVEMEALRAELENARSQLAILQEQRRRFLGQVDAPLEYATRVGLARSTGFNVLHHGDSG